MDSGIMDMAAYAELKSILGDTLNEVIRMYLQSTPEMIESLGEQIENENADQVFEISHRIKSSSSSIGALGIANTAEVIEQTSRAGSTENTQASLEILKKQYEEVQPFLTSESNA